MLAKFLVVEESTSIAPHSTVKVKLKDAGTSNVGFIFPAVEFAARGLILANAGLLLGPAEARVYNTKDVTQNISAGDCIAINVQMEGEGLKGEGLQAPVEETEDNTAVENTAEESAESETDENPEGSEESTEESMDEGSKNAEADEKLEAAENNSSEAELETDASPKKSSRSKK